MSLKRIWSVVGTAILVAAVAAPAAVLSVRAAESGKVAGTIKVSGVRDSANVVIFLEGAVKTAPATAAAHAVMDQKNLVFEPHVLPVVKGAKVEFPNSDNVRHNVYSPAGSAKLFNLGTYPVGTSKAEEFDNPGIVPLRCNVHSEMSAFIVVLDTPYFAITDKFGRFSINDVAPGSYTLRAWHEKVKSVERQITVEAGGPTSVQLEMSGRK